MFLAVDIGNSNIKFGIFDGERLISKFSIPSSRDLTADEFRSAISRSLKHPISSALICSVVPEINAALVECISGEFHFSPAIVTNDYDFGLTINYEPLSAIGTDRLVNAFAAAEKYGVPCLVCSFGTALTIDAVNENRVLLGGLIAPGMAAMAKSLHLNTSRLPEVPIEKPPAVIQNNTIGSIQSGITYGYFDLVDGLISRVVNEIGTRPRVIATGGFAPLIVRNTTLIDTVDENLLLGGLMLLQKRNQPA